jgi:beta-lactamase regulating signal transducer with metallopeptidase domain
MGWSAATQWAETWMQAMGRASLWGGLAIGGAWLVCRCLPRMSPRARSWIWRLVFLKLCLLVLWPDALPISLFSNPTVHLERLAPPADFRMDSWPASIFPGPTERIERSPAPAGRNSFEGQGVPRQGDLSSRPEALLPSDSRQHFAAWARVCLLVLWLGAVVLLAIRTTQGRLVAQKVLRESVPITDPQLREQCAVLSRQLRLKKPPGLRSQENVPGPLAAGVFRPVIVLPASFADCFTSQEIRLVLAHELAHLHRRDLFWGWLRHFVKAVLFFHPLVWVAHDEAALADEIACDEAALRAVNAPVVDYAGTLLRVTEQSLLWPTAALVAGGAGMSLSCRMMARRLQALPQMRNLSSRMARWKRRRATLLGCAALAVLLPVGLLTWFQASGIQQLDPRYRVLGFKVSRGCNHSLSIERGVCTFAGFRLSFAVEQKGPTPAPAPPAPGVWRLEGGMPSQVASWLHRLGIEAWLDSGSCVTYGVSDLEESCAVLVRFAHDPLWSGYQTIEACLVDKHGETIPLARCTSEFLPEASECVKVWVIRPAPLTREKFKLVLRQAAEGKEIAVLRLGKL